jgi:hypothetical protein
MDREHPSLDDIFGNPTSRQAELGDYIARRLGGGSTGGYHRYLESQASLEHQDASEDSADE